MRLQRYSIYNIQSEQIASNQLCRAEPDYETDDAASEASESETLGSGAVPTPSPADDDSSSSSGEEA